MSRPGSVPVPHVTAPPVRRVLLRTVRVYALCEDCGGSLRYTGVAWAAHGQAPAMAFHRCEGCKRDVTLSQKSPWLEYEEVAE